jgi:hypothetical protein
LGKEKGHKGEGNEREEKRKGGSNCIITFAKIKMSLFIKNENSKCVNFEVEKSESH